MSEADLKRRLDELRNKEAIELANSKAELANVKLLARKALMDFVGGVSFVALALALRPIAAALAFAGPTGFVLYYLALFFVVIVAPRSWIYGLVRSIRVLKAGYSLAPVRKMGVLALSLNFAGLSVWLVFAILRTVPWIPGSMNPI